VDSYARKLFGFAAACNFAVAFGFLFLRPVLHPLLPLDPVTGTNRVFFYLTAFLVAAFGYAYLRVAQDPRRYRPLIEIGVIGKALAVTAAAIPWLDGGIGWQLPALLGGDLLFVLLFLDYLRRTAGVERQPFTSVRSSSSFTS
jgi:hypothetical protein